MWLFWLNMQICKNNNKKHYYCLDQRQSRPGVSKVQPLSQTQLLPFLVTKVWQETSYFYSLLFSSFYATELSSCGLKKPKIFTLWPCIEKVF